MLCFVFKKFFVLGKVWGLFVFVFKVKIGLKFRL